MNENQFQTLMAQALMRKKVSCTPEEGEFWTGYIRGLRRQYHIDFGTDFEHSTWYSIPPDEPDMIRRARGSGYRTGYTVQV